MSPLLNIAVFISGTGSNLSSIIDHQCQYNYKVKVVISNKKDAKGLAIARSNDIDVFTFDWDEEDVNLFAVQQIVKKHQCELIVLAGFMKILPEPFINAFTNRIINIHPSLLPKYPGLNTHQRAIDNNDHIHGATVHFVNAELDAGTVISQTIVDVDNETNAQSLAQKVLFREHSLLPYTISLFSNKRLKWYNNDLYFDDLPLTQPIKLNE